jgi:hypothetical protein
MVYAGGKVQLRKFALNRFPLPAYVGHRELPYQKHD